MLTVKCLGCVKNLPIASEGYCSPRCAPGGSTANMNMNELYKLEDDRKSLFEFMDKLTGKTTEFEWKSVPLYKPDCACGFKNLAMRVAKFCPECGTSLEA